MVTLGRINVETLLSYETHPEGKSSGGFWRIKNHPMINHELTFLINHIKSGKDGYERYNRRGRTIHVQKGGVVD